MDGENKSTLAGSIIEAVRLGAWCARKSIYDNPLARHQSDGLMTCTVHSGDVDNVS